MSKLLIGLLAIGLSFLLIKLRFKVREFFGSISWMERWFGSTETGTVVIAILLFIWSLMYMTGTFDSFLLSAIGRIF